MVLWMRTIDLESLKIFRTVVDEGGVVRAANKLNRVQSNVTTRIRQLEEHLGARLFRREGRSPHWADQIDFTSRRPCAKSNLSPRVPRLRLR